MFTVTVASIGVNPSFLWGILKGVSNSLHISEVSLLALRSWSPCRHPKDAKPPFPNFPNSSPVSQPVFTSAVNQTLNFKPFFPPSSSRKKYLGYHMKKLTETSKDLSSGMFLVQWWSCAHRSRQRLQEKIKTYAADGAQIF